jgi:D-psicose/D-tagatose/L-ribulose 3-epimerase
VSPLAERARGLGFDVLELCIEDPAAVSAATLVAARDRSGIELSVCGAFGPDRDLASAEEAPRRNAAEYLGRLVELAAAVGSPHVCGPMYSAVGKAHPPDPQERRREWERAREGLRTAGELAAGMGVRLAVEPLNRYETDLVNTVAQGLELVRETGLDNVGLLLDTYHLNIEEKSVGDALRAAGERLFHVHACENDRGTPGTGHVPWREVFDALRDLGYGGQVVIESFTPAVVEIARAVSLWRPLDAEGDDLAAGGLAFLRESAA